MKKEEILRQALAGREEEVLHYQINIDNYRLAIEKIGRDIDLQDFKEQLVGLLRSSLIEQKKSKVMLDVIKDQLKEFE